MGRPRESWICCCEVDLLHLLVEPHQLLEPQLTGVEDTGHPVDQLFLPLDPSLPQSLVDQHTSRLAWQDGYLEGGFSGH